MTPPTPPEQHPSNAGRKSVHYCRTSPTFGLISVRKAVTADPADVF
ncbi:hypothetical protein [Leptolyngbya sp. PCC 6406]|nr:hypothetical protein [Leptolyngbya sp. PCC 6406]